MARAPRQSFVRRLLGLRLFLVVNVLVLFFLALSFGKEFVHNYEIQQEISQLQAQADQLAAHNFQVQQLSQVMQTESYVEREARLKLGLSKPGEQLVVVGQKDANAAPQPVQDDPVAKNVTLDAPPAGSETAIANPKKWWYYFFDRKMFDALKSYGSTS